MKVAILTMFSGLSATYSLVNVVADQIRMLLVAGISVKVLVSETCPDQERTGVFLDPRLEWVKITNTLEGKPIVWHDYSSATGQVHETFYQEAQAIDVSGAEILAVYPARLTTGKRLEKVAALAGGIKTAAEKRTKVIFCDFPCADIPAPVYKQMIRTEGKRFGLGEEDLLFTSDIGYPDSFPRQGVFELFQLSNLFLCPSYSESFGLTVLEAASRGNFLVLNEAVPALKELGGVLGGVLHAVGRSELRL